MFDQRASIWVHADGQRHLAVEKLYYAAPPTADVKHTSSRVGVLTDGRFVYLSALTPARMRGGVPLSKEILTVEVERDAIPR